MKEVIFSKAHPKGLVREVDEKEQPPHPPHPHEKEDEVSYDKILADIEKIKKAVRELGGKV